MIKNNFRTFLFETKKFHSTILNITSKHHVPKEVNMKSPKTLDVMNNCRTHGWGVYQCSATWHVLSTYCGSSCLCTYCGNAVGQVVGVYISAMQHGMF